MFEKMKDVPILFSWDRVVLFFIILWNLMVYP